jgi:hypothetical protein
LVNFKPLGIYVFRPFGNLVVIWYIFQRFGIFHRQKSGNPDDNKRHFVRERPFSAVRANIIETRVARWHNFLTKKSILCRFWWVLQSKMLVYLMAIWSISRPFGKFCGNLVHFVAIWYILWRFGTFCCDLVHFVAIWYILLQFGTFCGNLVHFMVIWYIFSRSGILYHEKSGNPDRNPKRSSDTCFKHNSDVAQLPTSFTLA